MWTSMFRFELSPWELVIRGTLIYWFLFFLFRFTLRRDAGSVGLADILLIVLIADAAQNGMSGEYKSVGEAVVLIGTIAAWNFWIDWMAFRYPIFARLAEPQVVPLIRHGKLLRANMRREMVTQKELESELRQSGLEELSQVKHAYLEPDGHISMIRYSGSQPDAKDRKTPGAA